MCHGGRPFWDSTDVFSPRPKRPILPLRYTIYYSFDFGIISLFNLFYFLGVSGTHPGDTIPGGSIPGAYPGGVIPGQQPGGTYTGKPFIQP